MPAQFRPRPWSEFFDKSEFAIPRPPLDLNLRISTNFSYFVGNYMGLIFFICMICSVIKPKLFLSIAVVFWTGLFVCVFGNFRKSGNTLHK